MPKRSVAAVPPRREIRQKRRPSVVICHADPPQVIQLEILAPGRAARQGGGYRNQKRGAQGSTSAAAAVVPDVRQKWLERLFTAHEEDGVPYIETLAAYWGELCVTGRLRQFFVGQIH